MPQRAGGSGGRKARGATRWVVAVLAAAAAVLVVATPSQSRGGVQARPASPAASLLSNLGASELAPLTIDYPLEGSVFPPEIVAPTFLWHDAAVTARSWLIEIEYEGQDDRVYVTADGKRPVREIDYRAVTENNVWHEPEYQAAARGFTPAPELWEAIKRSSVERDATISVYGLAVEAGSDDAARVVSRGSVRIRTSRDPLGASVFYRDVPLMPSKTNEGVIQPLAQSMFPLIQWRLRDISKTAAPIVMTHLPTCGNCHSFSADGKTLAMDMDGPGGDKGAYVVKDVSPRMVIQQDDVFTWNDFPDLPPDRTTFGLFAQISPDGRRVVTTLNEEIFVTNYSDILFQQTFYPTRGILAWYDRATKQIRRLPGADDPAFVQANPVWTPDGRTIYFLRAPARPAYDPGPRPTKANDPRETPMRYDVWRIPFNDGRGGVAEPVRGASDNGMSNSFPRISPDGKWLVFVQAKNGLLLRPDGQLWIVPAEGGEARRMRCNTDRMNSWHSWSPNGRWLVFSSKKNSPFTEMFLTHVDENGDDTPPILVPDSTAANRAVNLPELVRIAPEQMQEITTPAVDYRRHLDRARELRDAGKIPEAYAELDRSLELKPDYWETHLDYGELLAREGKDDAAIAHYRQALEVNPRYFYAMHNLGVTLGRTGHDREAIEQLGEALKINPGSAMTHFSLGRALVRVGRAEEAVQQFAAALAIDPALGDANLEWGIQLARRGAFDAAIEHFAREVQIDPDDFTAQHLWGLALVRSGRSAEALPHYRRAIEIRADYHPAYDGLARVLAAQTDAALRDGAQAVRLAEKACEMTGYSRADYLQTLAAAYAEAGRFDDAVRTAERAQELARAGGDGGLVRELDSQLALFRARRPLRVQG